MFGSQPGGLALLGPVERRGKSGQGLCLRQVPTFTYGKEAGGKARCTLCLPALKNPNVETLAKGWSKNQTTTTAAVEGVEPASNRGGTLAQVHDAVYHFFYINQVFVKNAFR